MSRAHIVSKSIWKTQDGTLQQQQDHVAQEEPLEIKIGQIQQGNLKKFVLSITMRTQGNDKDLVRGFLFTEGMIARADDILSIQTDSPRLQDQQNSLLVMLRPDLLLDRDNMTRHFYTSSSCGVCGKTSIELVNQQSSFLLPKRHPIVHSRTFGRLRETLRKNQAAFEQTGGLHAVGLFEDSGKLHWLSEDVGRHNAMDKLIGHFLKQDLIPLSKHMVVVSGRASFELVQKALMAGIPILAAVGAPSSLAIELAEENGMTLIGFLKEDSYNVYSHPERIDQS